MSPNDKPLYRLGTRGSPLALAQAGQVRARLAAEIGEPEAAIEIVILKTSGDRIQDRPLAEVGGKGLFTKELEEALLDRRIDLAVHSMKDVETHPPDRLMIAAILEREDARERLLAREAVFSIADLPVGARVGTSSLRRSAQLRALRADLTIAPLRGNVETRMARVASGDIDATLLAAAGLNRLGMTRVGVAIAVEEMLPAPAQGAVGLQIRARDDALAERLRALDHAPSAAAVQAERSLLAGLDGSCRTPIAALAEVDPHGQLRLRAEILRPDGRLRAFGQRMGPVSDASMLGRDLAEALRPQSPIPLGADAG